MSAVWNKQFILVDVGNNIVKLRLCVARPIEIVNNGESYERIDWHNHFECNKYPSNFSALYSLLEDSALKLKKVCFRKQADRFRVAYNGGLPYDLVSVYGSLRKMAIGY